MGALGLFWCLWAAPQEIEPLSRNAIVFVESTEPGEAWSVYRALDPGQPILLELKGPARLLLRMRSADAGAATVDVAQDGATVLEANLLPVADTRAKAVDRPGVWSQLRVFLVRVPEGQHRIEVVHRQGSAVLVGIRALPALEETQTEGDELPLAALKPRTPEVERLPTIAIPALPEGSDEASEIEAIAEVETATVSAPPARVVPMEPPPAWFWGLRAASQAGAGQPSLALGAGLSARVHRRQWSLGANLELLRAQADARVRQGAAVVGVGSVRWWSLTLEFEARRSWPGVVTPYLSAALGGGSIQRQQETFATADDRALWAFGAARAGLGWSGLFLEMVGRGGVKQGDPAATLGWALGWEGHF